MRAVVMRNKALAVADVPEPAPEAGEVLGLIREESLRAASDEPR